MTWNQFVKILNKNSNIQPKKKKRKMKLTKNL